MEAYKNWEMCIQGHASSLVKTLNLQVSMTAIQKENKVRTYILTKD